MLLLRAFFMYSWAKIYFESDEVTATSGGDEVLKVVEDSEVIAH